MTQSFVQKTIFADQFNQFHEVNSKRRNGRYQYFWHVHMNCGGSGEYQIPSKKCPFRKIGKRNWCLLTFGIFGVQKQNYNFAYVHTDTHTHTLD